MSTAARIDRATRGGARRRSRGFTMVELMVVLAIMAIMAALAAPSMSRLIAQQRLKSTASDLHLAILKARAEAIKRNVNVTVSPVDGSWANGWTIPDPVNPSAAPLEFRGPVSSVTVSTSATQVIYNGKGRTTTASASFVLSAAGVTHSRCVAIETNGRPYVKEADSC